MKFGHIYTYFVLGAVFGAVIACSPTKFSQVQTANICNSSTTNCVTQAGHVDVTEDYQIGTGKVDILFVNDNSASMSKAQVQIASRFSGFIQNLDNKNIDYRIAITTTDLAAVQQNKLITFGNGKKYLSKNDSDRLSLFNNTIIRNETIKCEEFIVGMFNTYGANYYSDQVNPQYNSLYYSKCPSPDTRGIYTANLVVAGNSDSFLRSDANLNVILISNDDVRKGKTMENLDTPSAFISMMEQKYANKYWSFNSIIVKDLTCKQNQTLKNLTNQVVPNISGDLGIQYANLSNSAAKDIDGNPRPRGQVLDICQSDYAQHFSTMSIQISEEARMFVMKCNPMSAPTVEATGNYTVPEYTWSNNKIVFKRGYEGKGVKISYRCYTGPT